MKKLPVLLGAVLALSACAPDYNPTINDNNSQLFSTTRNVIVRGIDGGRNGVKPPILVSRTYPILCAQDPLMDPPAIRAEQTVREIIRLIGPVTDRTGESYFKAEQMRLVNAVTVPQLKCQIGQFTEKQLSRDPAVISAFAAKNGVVLSGGVGPASGMGL